MTLAELEIAIHTRLALGLMAEHWLHRATRETDAGLVRTRPDLMEDTARALAATGPQTLSEAVELPGFLAVRVESAAFASWRRHRWVRCEGERIASEIVVADRRPGAPAPAPRWPVLGEPVSGRGQRAAADAPAFADPMSAEAASVAATLHRIVNGRRLDLAASAFAPGGTWDGPDGDACAPEAAAPALVRLLAAAPDLHATLDQIAEDGRRVAALWRIGASVQGLRVTGFVSCLATLADGKIADLQLVCDPDGMLAAARAPELSL